MQGPLSTCWGAMVAITGSSEAPTFQNTVVALDQAGELLNQVNAVLGGLVGADTNDRLQAINRQAMPLLTTKTPRRQGRKAISQVFCVSA